MLIAVCGLNGSGKTTLAERITEDLKATLIKFPNYKSETGQLIKDYLAGDRSQIDNPVAFQALQIANRAEVLPALQTAAGDPQLHIVLDRFWASGVVYGAIDGCPHSWLWNAHRSSMIADVNFLIDVNPDVAIARMVERNREEPRKYEKKRDQFVLAAKLYREIWDMPGRNIVIDGQPEPNQVYSETRKHLDQVMQEMRLLC